MALILMEGTIITTDSSMPTGLTDVGLLQLMQLTSPSLPIGGFAWSQGLEYAIDCGWLKSEADTAEWLLGIVTNSLANLDLPLLLRLHRAAEQKSYLDLERYNRMLLASRETAELHLEDVQMGMALKRLMLDLDMFEKQDFPESEVAYLTCFALCASHHHINEKSACLGFLWSWLENQIAAALKIFPLGQTAGQRVFHRLTGVLAQAVEYALLVEDDEIGNGMPAQIMASMLHEEQYSRLFRS